MFGSVIAYGSIAGLATILGMLLVLYKHKFAIKYSIYFVSFAVGILLGVTFFNLIPESIELYSQALIYVLVGFIVFYLLENLVVIHSCKEEDCEKHRISIMSVIGLGFHSLIDGIAIGVGFGISKEVGIVTGLGVTFHEFPEGIITLSLLFDSKIKRIKSIVYTVIVAIATPIGAIASFFLIKELSGNVLGLLIALAAGSFLYIAASDLIPETHKRFNKFNAVIVLIGIIFIYLITNLLG
jgi:ZIP family zinc transporter/zinc and cadmium transporter